MDNLETQTTPAANETAQNLIQTPPATTEQNVVETKASDLIANASNSKVEDTVTTTTDVESDFDIDLDEVLQAPAGKKKIAASALKEIDDDIYSDDDDLEVDERTGSLIEKLAERAKGYKKSSNDYKTVAEANQIIKNDEQIKKFVAAHDMADDELVRQARYLKLKNAGFSDEDANAEADGYIDKLNQSDGLLLEQAKEIRLDLRAAINNRSKHIQGEIEKTTKALSLSASVDPELITKATKHLSKTDNFLGLKIGGKNEQSRKDFFKPVEKAIKDGTLLKEIQTNPELLAEFGLFKQYKEQFKVAIEKRQPNRKQQLQTLQDAPHTNGTAAARPVEVPKSTGALPNPKGFK